MPVPVIPVCGYHAVMINNERDCGGEYYNRMPDVVVKRGRDGLVYEMCRNVTMSEAAAKELREALQSWLNRSEALRNGDYGQC